MRRVFPFVVLLSLLIAASALARPSSGFTYAPIQPATNESIRFEPRAAFDANASNYSYSWDFGDGDFSGDERPLKTYAAAGSYAVTVTVVDNSDGTSRSTMQTVTVAAAPNRWPVARFSFTPASPTTGQAIAFNSTSTDPDSDPLAHSWSFGDGTSSNDTNSNKTYPNAGQYTVTLTVSDGRGGTHSTSQTVTVAQANRAPSASFVASVVSVTQHGSTVDFDGSGSSDPDFHPLTYSWDFGDANGGSGAAVQHVYATPGTYRVRLTVSDGQLANTAEQTITTIAPVNHPPVAGFTHAPTRPVAGQTVTFTNTSSDQDPGDSLRHSWDFHDGTTSTAMNPSKVWSQAGDYVVTLTVDDNHLNGVDSAQVIVSVDPPPNQPPTADFSFSPASPLAGQSITFTNLSGDPDHDTLSYQWDFGDATSSTLRHPAKTYANAGQYNVTLTVDDGRGGTHATTHSVTVTSVGSAPVASFTATVLSVTAQGAAVAFDASGTTDPDGDPLTYSWDFGDRTGGGSGAFVEYVYAFPNTYRVTLTVSDGRFTATAVQDVMTTAPPNHPPTADFDFAPLQPVAGQPVAFTNRSTDPDAGDSLRHQWDFHDGSTSTLAGPTHVFAQPGDYLVTLVADDDHLNGTDDVQKLVTVAPAPVQPVADFTFAPAEPLPGQTIVFTNLSAGGDPAILSYSWNFGDLTSSTLKNPTRSYAVAATYTVTLTVSNFHGTATIARDITVGGNQPPVLADVRIPSAAQAGQAAQFSAAATDLNHDAVTATWTFGDGSTATGWSVTHTYAAAGTYTVTVRASDGRAEDSQSGTITVTVPPPPPPTKLSAYSIHAASLGNPYGIPIQFGGLDARQTRQWVHWTGCAPGWYPNGDPDIGYDLPAIRTFAAANPGRLYIFVDEPGHGTPGNHKDGAAPGCTQVTPRQYARAYEKFVADVRAADPTARFSPGGFEQFPANASAYGAAFVDYATEFYNAYLSEYGIAPPVAEWRFHVYWESHWTLMSDWQGKAAAAIAFAEQHGAPVVLGIGFPWHETYDPRMLDAMSWIADYVRNAPAVSSVFWWSYDFHEDGYNRLTTYTGGSDIARTLTTLGQAYQSLINGGSALPVASPAGSLVSVTPDAASQSVLSSSSGSRNFTVTNVGDAFATYRLRASCGGAIVNCGAASVAEVALAAGQSATVSVSYTAGASGPGELRLAAAHTIAANITDVGSYIITVSAPAFPIDFSPHNAENVDLSQFAANLSYTTPAYFALDQERSVTLFYSSAQAIPAGLVQVDVEDTSATPPEQYSILLRTPDGTPVELTNGVYENFYRGGSGVTRLAAQFGKVGGQWLPTGAHNGVVVVRKWRGGQIYEEASQPVRVLVLNERSSAAGPGWSIGGLQRIHVQAGGSLVVTSGLGTIQYYERPAQCGQPCTYVRPRGEWSDIVFDGVNYTRRYPGGATETFALDGTLLSTEDRHQNRTQYRQTGGRLEEIVDPFGNSILLQYLTGLAGTPRLWKISDYGARTVTITRDAAGNIVQIADPENTNDLQLAYDADSRLQTWTDRAGGRWDVAYDHAGMVASSTAPAVDIEGRPARPVSRAKSLHAAVLPPNGIGLTLSNPAPRVAASDIEIAATDARGNTTYSRIDRFGSAVWIKDAVGRITSLQRNADSQVERSVGPAGHIVKNVWSGPLLLQTTDETLGTTVNYQYEPGGWQRVTRMWGDDIPETIYEYGSLDRVKVRRDASSFDVTTYHVNPRGQVEEVDDPEGHATYYHYDARGNLTAETSGDAFNHFKRGSESITDAFGRVTHVYRRDPAAPDGKLLMQTTTYDVLNRVRTQTDAMQQTTTYTYDGERGLRTVRDPLGQTYTFERNVLGWVEAEIDPTGRATRQAFDAAGNLSRLTNRRGQAVTFGYDAANRMIHRDADGQRTTWTYHSDHRTVTVSNPESTDEFTVDAAGRPDVTRISRGSIALTLDETVNRRGQRELLTLTGPWNTRTIGYGYDAQGTFETLRDFNGETTRLVRNADGVVTHTYYPRFGIVHESGALHTIYSQHFTGLSASGNPGVGYNFDSFGRVAERYPAATATSFWKYRYDPVGRLKAAEEWDKAGDVCTNDPDRGVVCEPDPAYSPAPRPLRTFGYAYDVVGNPAASGAEIKPGNRLTKYKNFVMEYDEDGNLKLRYTPDWWTFNQTLTWNSLGQLTSVNGVSYGYDGLGRRVRRTVGGTTRHYVYDGDDLIMELGAGGSVQREYVHFPGTDEPHSIRLWDYGMNGATNYYVTQRPGSVTAMVDTFGNVVREFRYDPYGNPDPGFENDDSQNPLRFASREWDAQSGLYYLRSRWYSPVLERFISEDPIGLGGGINPYAYVSGDPVNGTDSSGLKQDCSDEDWLAGKCIGFVLLPAFGRPVPRVPRIPETEAVGNYYRRHLPLRGLPDPDASPDRWVSVGMGELNEPEHVPYGDVWDAFVECKESRIHRATQLHNEALGRLNREMAAIDWFAFREGGDPLAVRYRRDRAWTRYVQDLNVQSIRFAATAVGCIPQSILDFAFDR